MNTIRSRTFFANIGLLFVAPLLSSCSSSESPQWEVERDRRYEVSVYSDGKQVKDFNKELGHRVELTPSVVSSMEQQGRRLPFDGRSEHDARGNIVGIRIASTKQSVSPAFLGLREKDLITAVGLRRVRKSDDVRQLFSELAQSKTSTLTLERDGRAHKIIYYIAEQAPKPS